MSYCRFSSDSFRSDVYAYQDETGGIVIHIASRRRENVESLGPNPLNDASLLAVPFDSQSADLVKLYKSYNIWMKKLGDLELVDIKHPMAGLTIYCSGPREAKSTLLQLKLSGLYVPALALALLDDEIEEDDAAQEAAQDGEGGAS